MLRAPHSTNRSTSPRRGWGFGGLGGTLPPPELLLRFEKPPQGETVTSQGSALALTARRPREAAPSRPSAREGRGARGFTKMAAAPAFHGRAASSSSGSSSYFLWFPFPRFTHQEIKHYDNGFNFSKLKAFNPSTSKFTTSSTIHLPKPPSLRAPHLYPPTSSILPLFSLCQTPPKSFTNSSAPLASCALQFT